MKRPIILTLMIFSTLFSACKSKNVSDEQTIVPQVTDSGVTVLSDRITDEGVRELSVKPSSVCSTQIDVAVKDGTIVSVVFTDGCPGNTMGVSKLVEGMSVEEAISRLKGIDCAGKGTSCPDQLTMALELLR